MRHYPFPTISMPHVFFTSSFGFSLIHFISFLLFIVHSLILWFSPFPLTFTHSFILAGGKKLQNPTIHSQRTVVNKAVGPPSDNISHMFTCHPSVCSCFTQLSTAAVPSSLICPHTSHSHNRCLTQPLINPSVFLFSFAQPLHLVFPSCLLFSFITVCSFFCVSVCSCLPTHTCTYSHTQTETNIPELPDITAQPRPIGLGPVFYHESPCASDSCQGLGLATSGKSTSTTTHT
ncbi:UNVERIFIED_CONTAM: hypothetical protein K2H54_039945 [Gekko kuhli]